MVSLECTFVLRKVKNEFKVLNSTLFFKGYGSETSAFHRSLNPTPKSSCWISAPSSCVFSFCIQVDVFRDSLAPVTAGTPKTLGDVFIQINTKIEFGKTVVLFQKLPWLIPSLPFYCGKNIEVIGTVDFSLPFLICRSCQNLKMAFLCFYLWMRESGITNTLGLFICPVSDNNLVESSYIIHTAYFTSSLLRRAANAEDDSYGRWESHKSCGIKMFQIEVNF